LTAAYGQKCTKSPQANASEAEQQPDVADDADQKVMAAFDQGVPHVVADEPGVAAKTEIFPGISAF